MNSKFEVDKQDKTETISFMSCSNSNFEFTRCCFSESAAENSMVIEFRIILNVTVRIRMRVRIRVRVGI